ncbi:hypothetical protein MMC12_008571, partial [Toensbergia leucococca]|nr:hypothetical protein [Toensbergia leucococca]
MTAKTPDVLQLPDTWEAEEDLARDDQWLITNYVRDLLMTPSSNFRWEGLNVQRETFSVGIAVLDLHIRNVHGPQASRAEDLPSRGNLGTLTAARRYDDDEDENSEPPPTHDQPSRTIVDPNYWDNTYPLPSLSMESMMSSFAIKPVNGRNIGPSQRVGPGDPTVQPPREYTVVFEARGVNQRTQFASNTLFQAFLHRLEMELASVASSTSMKGRGEQDLTMEYSLPETRKRAGEEEASRRRGRKPRKIDAERNFPSPETLPVELRLSVIQLVDIPFAKVEGAYDLQSYERLALDEIRGCAEKWGRLQDAYDAANTELMAVMREIEDDYTMENHNPVHNRFLRADHEAIVTVEKPSTVRTVPDDFIYIAMDRCQVVVKFLWPEGIQCLYDEKVPETVARQLTTYFSIEPPPVPDKAQPPERLCAPLGPPLADSPGRQNLSLVNCSYSTYVD